MSEYIAAARSPSMIRTSEESGLPPNRDPTQSSFGRVIGQTDPSVFEEATEYWPASQHVVVAAPGFAAFTTKPTIASQVTASTRNTKRGAYVGYAARPVLVITPSGLSPT
jgi:hypothetical protein